MHSIMGCAVSDFDYIFGKPGSETETKFLVKVQETESLVNYLLSFIDIHFNLIDREYVVSSISCKEIVRMYFMTAVDIVCQSMDRDDMVWCRTSLDTLMYIGFTRDEGMDALKYFVEGSYSHTDSLVMQESSVALHKYREKVTDIAVPLELLIMAHSEYKPNRDI